MTEITIYEVGPRDGLQNEKTFVSTADKIELINLLSKTGLKKIEATSFVSPKWVPQLADGADVMAGIERQTGVSYAALVPNQKGFDLAIEAGAAEIAIFAAASETFSQKNTNCSIKESIARFAPIMAAAAKADIPVRGYVSCITDCPYEGAIDPMATKHVTKALFELGCYEVSLGDTIGHATPQRISTLLETLIGELPASRLAGHFHDTKGYALENVEVSLAFGLSVFDSSVSGLGGCPFAPGAKGNLATGKLVKMLDYKGLTHGVDIQKLVKAEAHVAALRLDQMA